MRVALPTVTLLVTICLPYIVQCQHHALYVRRDELARGNRVTRQTSADQMVQNILQWLQGVYAQNSRRIRQGSFREYLPPTNTQKPRPFQPNMEDNFIGYPPSGLSPNPPFGENGSNQGYVPPRDLYATQRPSGFTTPRPRPGYPETQFPGYPSPGYPPAGPPGTKPPVEGTSPPSYTPPATQPPPYSPPPTQPPTYSPPPTQPPTYSPPPTQPPTYSPPPTQPPTYSPPPTQPPTYSPPPTQPPTYSPPPTYPPGTPPPPTYAPPTGPPPTYQPPGTQPPPTYAPPTGPPTTQGYGETTQPAPGSLVSTTTTTGRPYTSEPAAPGEISNTNAPSEATPTEDNTIRTDGEGSETSAEEDLSHPPHIHAIDVECAKDMMTINIEFNRQFDGIIYSKGFYNNPECRYVNENSGQTKFMFTVSLNSCGTEFVNAFDTQGQSYLENVLVLQNEKGIQEVWDTIRAVRCLWEGNLNKALSVALSVGMLTQEIVTFSGDTAMARLDIQMGRGPFAPTANGLVKIGEVMTLAVSVTGDPGFDIQVKDCRAKDASGENEVALTDENGCVLKPKLFGSFQKTRETQNTGASIIAYAFFNAFKFPDVMDLMIECNVELCKTDCEMCPDPNQKTEPGRRRRRDLYVQNDTDTLGEPVRMGKTLRVILPEDLSEGEAIVNLLDDQQVCLSSQSFFLSSAILITLLISSSIFSASMWLKNQHLSLQKHL